MNFMWYRAGKVCKNAILAFVVYYIIWIGGAVILKHKDYMVLDDMIWIILMVSEVYPLKELQEFQTFCYCRKKRYVFCILGEGLRAIIYGGIFRTGLQLLFYEEYVKAYTGDASKELISQYHQCPVWELCLVNIALIFIVRMVMVLDSTRKYPILNLANTFNKKKRPVMSGKRKLFRILEYPIMLVVWFVSLIVLLGSYNFMLTNTIRDKVGIYLAGFVVSIVLLGILWWRFRSGKKMET